MPTTRLGRWSVRLILLFFLFLLIFSLFIASGQRGGEKYFDNLILAVPFTTAVLCGITGFFTGLYGIFIQKEKSLLVAIATILGFLITLFMSTEVLFPH